MERWQRRGLSPGGETVRTRAPRRMGRIPALTSTPSTSSPREWIEIRCWPAFDWSGLLQQESGEENTDGPRGGNPEGRGESLPVSDSASDGGRESAANNFSNQRRQTDCGGRKLWWNAFGGHEYEGKCGHALPAVRDKAGKGHQPGMGNEKWHLVSQRNDG